MDGRVIDLRSDTVTRPSLAMRQATREKAYHRSQTALVAFATTHNMAGGTVDPTPLAHDICDRGQEAGLRVHLEGARIFNAAIYLGEKVGDMTTNFDSVQFGLS